MHPKVRNPLVVCVRRPPAYLWSPWILPIMVCIALPCDAEYALRSPGVPNFRLPCCEGSRTLALTCCRKRERRRSGRWRQSGAVLCSVVAPWTSPPLATLLRRSRNVRPQCRWGKAREMANIRCRDYDVCGSQCHGLRRENHIPIEGLVIGGRSTLLTGLGPKDGSLPHRRRGEGQVLQPGSQSVEARQPSCFICTQELPTHFVVGDLWHEHAAPVPYEGLQPLCAGDT